MSVHPCPQHHRGVVGARLALRVDLLAPTSGPGLGSGSAHEFSLPSPLPAFYCPEEQQPLGNTGFWACLPMMVVLDSPWIVPELALALETARYLEETGEWWRVWLDGKGKNDPGSRLRSSVLQEASAGRRSLTPLTPSTSWS